jgi:RHS repeat-associated protein
VYDNAWRLQSLTSPAGTFTYGYKPSSPSALIQNIALPNFASISNHFDTLARLDGTALLNYWGHVLDGYSYGMDNLGLRTSITRNFGLTTNSVAIGYDNIGQITSWTASESGGTLRQNEQLGFGYDPAGNLHLRTNGGLVQSFSTDAVNQLTNITRIGVLTVSGAIPAPATNLTVNGAGAQVYGDLTFAGTNNSLLNGSNSFTIIARNVYGTSATNVVSVNLPATNTLMFDANGNLTNDGTRSFVYDAADQLTNVNVAGAWKTEFAYDGLGRRRIQRDYTWQSSNWVRTNETRFIFDGMLPIQERDSNNAVRVTYTRGLDLGGGFQGAGGIGGLLARTDTNGSTFYHSDGTGNITALMDGNQNIAARYLYDPFGRVLAQWGRVASANAMQFSSMPHHGASGLSGYAFRFYDPSLQRFLNHDPIGEAGGINPYEFVSNDPLTIVDPDGDSDDNVVSTASIPVNQLPGRIVNPIPLATPPDESAIFHAGVDMVALGDPTGASSALNAVIYAGEGNWSEAGKNAIYAGPLIGEQLRWLKKARDAAKAAKAAKAAANCEKAAAKELEELAAKTGGRLGSASTRQLNSKIAGKLEQHGMEITGGGGRAPETFLPGAGPGTKGGNFKDITAVRDGEVLHVNTVSTLADGVTPTAQEAAAAAEIRAKLGPGERLILVPKKP